MSLLIIEHSELTGSDRLGERLQNDGHRLLTVRIHLGETLPSDLDEIDGVISCGGPQAPTCDEPWIDQELNLLRSADAMHVPVLGICLGAQLLAVALGGDVSRCDEPEMGWYDITLTPAGRDDVLFAGQPWFGSQLQWHQWQVSTLPENATLLASSGRCNIQAWMRGINTYAVQFHPECYKKTIASWITDDAQQLVDAGISGDAINKDTEQQFDAYERLTDRFFDAISQLLIPIHTRLTRQRH